MSNAIALDKQSDFSQTGFDCLDPDEVAIMNMPPMSYEAIAAASANMTKTIIALTKQVMELRADADRLQFVAEQGEAYGVFDPQTEYTIAEFRRIVDDAVAEDKANQVAEAEWNEEDDGDDDEDDEDEYDRSITPVEAVAMSAFAGIITYGFASYVDAIHDAPMLAFVVFIIVMYHYFKHRVGYD